jgi:hypothetical protein
MTLDKYTTRKPTHRRSSWNGPYADQGKIGGKLAENCTRYGMSRGFFGLHSGQVLDLRRVLSVADVQGELAVLDEVSAAAEARYQNLGTTVSKRDPCPCASVGLSLFGSAHFNFSYPGSQRSASPARRPSSRQSWVRLIICTCCEACAA